MIICATTVLQGCIPLSYEWRPGAAGVVKDQSGYPLDGVNLTLEGPVDSTEQMEPRADAKHVATYSDNDGQFRIPPEHRWWWRPLLPIPIDPKASLARLTASKDGYQSLIIFVTEGREELGTIVLEKK
jgi:hypothetical protein